LNQCCGNKQLPFSLPLSSSSNQNIKFKNSTLTKIETLNLKSKNKKNKNQWRLKFTSTRSYNTTKDCGVAKEVNAMSTYQQASGK